MPLQRPAAPTTLFDRLRANGETENKHSAHPEPAKKHSARRPSNDALDANRGPAMIASPIVNPSRTITVAAALVIVGITIDLALRFPASTEADTVPYARWRNGVIIHVRNCDPPASEDALLRCAALHCAQRVTQRLTNAKQATLAVTHYTRSADGQRIEISGVLEQHLRAPTLPTGFHCRMADYREAVPEFEFGHRGTVGAVEAGIDFARP